MKEFEKWFKKVMQPRLEKGENIYEGDCELAWKAALGWILKNRKPYYNVEDKKVVATDSDILYKELEEQNGKY